MIDPSLIAKWLKKHLDSIFAALIGFVIIYLFTEHGGIGISPDSIAYTSTARNIVAGNGFMQFGGQPLVDFPVFYPLFLSFVMSITHTDIIECATILNGLMFASLIFMCGVIMEKFTRRSKWYKIILLFAITTSPALIDIYTMLWSETLFIILTLVFYIAFRYYYQTHSLKRLLFPAIVAAVAFDTRYAGITLIATGEALLFFDKQLAWKNKIKHFVIFGLIGCSLATINLIHNAFATGLLTGKRQKGITPLSDNIAYSGNVLSDWTSISGHNKFFFIGIGILAITLFIWLFFKNMKKKADYHSYENSIITFFIVYVSFIILSSTISRYERINNRLLSAAFLPFIWGITYKIPSWIRALQKNKHKWSSGIIFTAIAVAICSNYYSINTYNYSFMRESGIPGYTEDTWRQSPTLQFVQKNRIYFNPDSMVYSNHNQAIYFYTNYAVDAVPEKAYKEDVKMFAEESPLVLIWFYNDTNHDVLSLDEIKKIKTLKLLHQFNDGAIYLCLNKDTSNAKPPRTKTTVRSFE